jgi:hypothetical protein
MEPHCAAHCSRRVSSTSTHAFVNWCVDQYVASKTRSECAELNDPSQVHDIQQSTGRHSAFWSGPAIPEARGGIECTPPVCFSLQAGWLATALLIQGTCPVWLRGMMRMPCEGRSNGTAFLSVETMLLWAMAKECVTTPINIRDATTIRQGLTW